MRKLALSLIIVLSVYTAGCGGGGGYSPSAGGASSGTLSVFATDAFTEDYDQVWVKIHRVELLDASGAAETVFEDAAGVEINLKTLRDATGQRFALLARNVARSRTHTQARVTVADDVVLFPRGANSGQDTPVSDSFDRDSSGHPRIVFPLTQPRNLGAGNDDLVIDFDLANFALAGGKIAPTLKEGGRSGIEDSARHESSEFAGTVSNLTGTAPNQYFTLSTVDGEAFTVQLSAASSVFNNNSAASPTLVNGTKVEIRGTFDVSANRFAASVVKIKNVEDAAGEAGVNGAASEISATAGTFTLSVHQANGFLPTHTSVSVVTNSATLFRANRGTQIASDLFFAGLSSAASVEVEGAYDAATNTLTARKIRLDSPDDSRENQSEARGLSANVNAVAKTFRIGPLSEWQGFIPAGSSIGVTANAGTRYRAADGTEITADTFFAALASPAQVSVEGAYANNAITASQLRLRNAGSGNSNGGSNDNGIDG